MEIRNLKTFIQVAELGSFTRAAQKLGYSQSTVSFQIRQLELELDTQLFERINHTVALTERGREVLLYAHQIIKLEQEMSEAAREGAFERGHIRIAMADSLCSFLLEKRFVQFRKLYPNITCKIITAGTEEMFRLLNQNQVDFVFTLDSHIYNADYVIVKEGKIGMHFVGQKGCLQEKMEKVSIAELIKESFLLTEKGMSYRRLMDEKLAAMSMAVEPILETGNTDLICRLVGQGAGISFLPDYATAQAVGEGQIVYLPVDDFEIEIWEQMLYHRDKWVSPQMQAVIDFFRG